MPSPPGPSSRVAWGIVGLLPGQGVDRVTTDPCPEEADDCLCRAVQTG